MKRIALGAALALFVLAAGAAAMPGVTLLPTGWSIRGADGPVATVGTLPSGLALSRDGARVFALEAGYDNRTLRTLDAATLKEQGITKLNGAFGAPLRDADGDGVWVSVAGTFQEQIAHIDTARAVVDRDVTLPIPFYPVAIARSPRSGMLAVAGDLANRVAFVDPVRERVAYTVDVGHHPAAMLFSPDGGTLYVADRGETDLDVVDVATRRVRARIRVGLHPVALASDGHRLFVADSDDDDVAVVDLAQKRVVQRARVPFARDGVVGTSPNALALDGDRLYVSCGAANAVAVFAVAPTGITPLGALAVGWYPTAVAVDHAHGALYVADGKGESGHPNPQYVPNKGRTGYIASQLSGSIRRYALPTDAVLRDGLRDVRALAQHEAVPASTIVRANGPIKHVIYVIKENRSYDQVLGDVAGADGDPSLVLFGKAITPNQHAIVERFGVFDRFLENAHVSADGHNWSTAAFANDYLEHMWPQQYSGRRAFYDFEDGAEASAPHGGYLWDDAVRHGVSLRNYGEFVSDGPGDAKVPVSTSSDVLRTRTDRAFPTFDLDVRESRRFAEWKREFDAFERTHTLPQLEIVRFPNDHTSGTAEGKLTPQAFVAENDLAVGELVEAVSHSADWPSTAIFVVEDDAQNGPDHVDEQRSTFYLASPYAAGGVQHAHYTQASVLRTIEILLGLSPMTPYDAGALPMTAAFHDSADVRPFDAIAETYDITTKNTRAAYRATDSTDRLDFAHADAVDDATLNDILWHAVKGARATPPPYGAFRGSDALKDGGAQAKDDDESEAHADHGAGQRGRP